MPVFEVDCGFLLYSLLMVCHRVCEFLLWVPICSSLVFHCSVLCALISLVMFWFSSLMFGSDGFVILSS